MNSKTNDEILKFREACEFLRFSENTVRRMLVAGELPVYKVHGRLRFLKSELIDWLKQHKVPKNA